MLLLLFLPLALSGSPGASAQQEPVMSTFDISDGDKTYTIQYHMTNGGSITNVEFHEQYMSLYLTVESPSEGHLQLIFSRQTYDALSFTEHFEPLVFLDGRHEVMPSEIGWECHQISYSIPVEAGTEQVDLVYADILMEHTHGYPQIIEITESIEVDGVEFGVRLKTDSTKCDVSFISEEKKIRIDIEGRHEAEGDRGHFELVVVHDLIGGNYTVLADGQPLEFEEEQFFIRDYSTVSGASGVRDELAPHGASRLVFDYPKDAGSIEVIGSTVFPEPGGPFLTPKRDLLDKPVILSYNITTITTTSSDVNGQENRTLVDLLITDEENEELVKDVIFDLELTRAGGEPSQPLLLDTFHAPDGAITLDIMHQGPAEVFAERGFFFHAWVPDQESGVIPMTLPLEPDSTYVMKIEILTTDNVRDLHHYPEESLYVYFATNGSEVGEIRVIPEFTFHAVAVALVIPAALIGIAIAMNRVWTIRNDGV